MKKVGHNLDITQETTLKNANKVARDSNLDINEMGGGWGGLVPGLVPFGKGMTNRIPQGPSAHAGNRSSHHVSSRALVPPTSSSEAASYRQSSQGDQIPGLWHWAGLGSGGQMRRVGRPGQWLFWSCWTTIAGNLEGCHGWAKAWCSGIVHQAWYSSLNLIIF